MSAFQVTLTPTRLNKKRKDAIKEPTDVILAPFSAKSIVTFEEIPVTKTAERVLNILNPSDEEIKVMVTKGFKPEQNMSLEWTTNVIPAQSQITMNIVWNPLKEITCKEAIQITDNRNFKKDIVVILKSIPKPKKVVRRFPNITSKMFPVKTLKLKSPTGNSNKILAVSQQQQRKRRSNLQQQTENFVASPLLEKNDGDYVIYNESQSISTNIRTKVSTNKENVSPVTPNNISSILDNIKFTPATETKLKGTSHLDYLASLPTPNSVRDNKTLFEDSFLLPRRLPIDCSPEKTDLSKNIKNINFESTPYKKTIPTIHILPSTESIYLDPISDKLIPKVFVQEDQSTTRTKLSETRPINKTFDINPKINETSSCSLDSYHEINDNIQQSSEYILEKINISGGIENREHYAISSGSSRLSVIDEESSNKRSPNSYTFQKPNEANRQKLDQSLKRDINLVGTPLRKYSESMRELSLNNNIHHSFGIQGSMPNLNNMEKIQSIEQNRYFNTHQIVKNECLSSNSKNLDLSNCSSVDDNSLTSIVSVSELPFNPSEILAASSRFNIHEAGRKKLSPFSIKREPQTPKYEYITNISFNNKQDSKYQKRTRENDSPNSSNYIKIPKPINIAVSPPKRTKFNITEDNNNLSAVNFRSNKWGQIQPKKLRIQKTLSLVRRPITPRKIKVELEPRSLYNTDMHLSSYINPDPFAATTTCDPFLSHSIYLDEHSLKKYESQMKKCLNALVSMPAELDPDCEQKVDVGKIFNEVRNKELILAPTKEEQSMTYLTKARMGTLRAAAFRLYISDEMCSPCGKVAVYIKKGSIKIRPDRDLHLDVVMQRNILELLLCFNPLWLRIGLEVVFNEEIHLHSNSDIVGLSTFILNRLFKDKFMERKYSKAFTLSEEYSNHIKSFSLQKFLFLLLFLDKAKNKKIIKHNPCLFVKKSKHKETKDILLRFSSELLASVGDITKELKRMGYVLTHKQNFIDEFDYAFNNLAVDLRDGIRLTRVMEIILLRDDLTKQLRCPAISRLQRVFNINLGLKALSDAEFDLKGNIYAADIVDGHREKTLSLLWQIIYKFRAPKFIAAATVLQKWWRSSWLKVVIKRRIQYKEYIRKNKAAIVIQSYFRGYMSKKYVELFKWERTNAAICLQKYCRRLLAMKRLRTTLNSIVFIQRWYRYTKLKITARTKFVLIRNSAVIIQYWYKRLILARKIEYAIPIIREAKAQAKFKYEKAIILQRSIKSFIIHKKLRSIVNGFINYNRRSKLQFRSASKIQSYFKMIQLRREFLIKRCSIIKIQKYWKSYIQMRIDRARFIGKRQAAIAIQKQFKSYKLMQLHRVNYIKLKTTVLIIQTRYRANKLCQIHCEKYNKIRQIVIRIQQHWRATILMRKVHSEYIINRQKIIRIQQILRGNKEMVLQREKYRLLKHSAIIIQRKYRATIKMRIEKLNYQKVRSSSIIIQRKLRATLVSRKIRYEFIQIQYNVILMQQRFRANCLMRKERAKYLQLKQITISMQRRFRANLLKQKEHTAFLQLKKATIAIQQQYKNMCLMRKHRQEFLQLKYATSSIQQQFRALCVMRNKRGEYLTLKKYVIFIQRKFRANKVMKLQRKEYLNVRQACVLIQIKFKAYSLMRIQKNVYLKLKKSAIFIQQQFRALIAMRQQRIKYLFIIKSICLIQEKFRAFISMRQQHQEYLKIKSSTITIQQRYRAILCMRIERIKYNNLLLATRVIQQQFRAVCEMRKERAKYIQFKKATITIQQQYRNICLMRKHRQEFLQLKYATSSIQQQFRALCVMRNKRGEYLTLKKYVIFIQRKFRANKVMKLQRKEYLNVRQACVLIQIKFKAYSLMRIQKNEYLKLKRSAIFIQQQFRALIAMRQQRIKYLFIIKSICLIQEKFRAFISMRQQHQEYLKIKSSTIIIQQRYRAILCMRIERIKYNNLLLATRVIQQQFRAVCAMRKERAKYIQFKKATITIQQQYRNICLMRKHRQGFLQLKYATSSIQQQFRALCVMRNKRGEYLTLKKYVIFIQRTFRANKVMKLQRKEYLNVRQACVLIQIKFKAYSLMRIQKNEYLKLKKSAIIIQQQFRALIAMRQQRTKYLCIIKSICLIQEKFRAFTLMRKQRQEYLKIISSAIIIQQRYRATLCMRIEQNKYDNLLLATLVIQQQFRAVCAMRKERSKYIQFKKAALIIQQNFKSYKKMKTERVQYLEFKRSVVIIQQKYRAKREMLKLRNQYLLIHSLIICIQRKFRANQEMKFERRKFLKLKSAAIKVQQIYRANKEMKNKRINYLELKQSILKVQTFARGFLARKQFNAMMTPEMKELIRQKRAAKIIQRYWRGYRVRAKWRNLKLVFIRKRIKELKQSATSCDTVKYKISASVKFLKGRFNVQEALTVLLRLENMSRTVPHLLMEHSSYISTFCYGIMAQAIRSEADKHVIEFCSRIILNLARYNSTTANTFQENGLVTIAQMLMRWCDKDCEIFNTLCTLIWVFSHCPVKNQKIRKFMTDSEAIYLLRETKKLVLRKDKMRQNVRKSSVVSVKNINTFPPKALPSLGSDFGIISGKPYTFISSVFAFDVILAKLGISEII